MQEQKVKLSIIILEIKDPKQLNKCLQSIEAQTFKNYEILIVDKGGYTPELQKLIGKAYLENRKIRIIVPSDPENCFIRKEGLDAAQGEYVIFIDSSDRLAPEASSKLIARAEQLKTDIVICNVKFTDQKSGKELTIPEADQSVNFPANSDFETYIFDYRELKPLTTDRFITIWNKLYSKQFLDVAIKFAFRKDEFYASVPFQLQMLLRAEKMAFCPEILYEATVKYEDIDQIKKEDDEKLQVIIDRVKLFLANEKELENYSLDFLSYIYNEFAFVPIAKEEDRYATIFLQKVRREFSEIINKNDEMQHVWDWRVYKYIKSAASGGDKIHGGDRDSQKKIAEITESYDLQSVILQQKEQKISAIRSELISQKELLKEQEEHVNRLKKLAAERRRLLKKLRSSIPMRIFNICSKIINFPIITFKKIFHIKRKTRI